MKCKLMKGAGLQRVLPMHSTCCGKVQCFQGPQALELHAWYSIAENGQVIYNGLVSMRALSLCVVT